MGLKTLFPTAFQPFVFRDGSLGAVWLGIHVRHGVVGLRVGKRTNLDTSELPAKLSGTVNKGMEPTAHKPRTAYAEGVRLLNPS